MKQFSFNHTDTAISGVTELKLSRGLINFDKDFRVKQDEPSEAIATNLTSPIGKPEAFRWGWSEVGDVYKSSSIDRAMQSPSKRGYQILCQLTDVGSVSDSTDPSFGYDVPLEGHIVLKVPAEAALTESDIMTFIGRLVSGLFETGSENESRLKALLRGSLLPADLS